MSQDVAQKHKVVRFSQFLRLRNDLHGVGWGVKLYSHTHSEIFRKASPNRMSNKKQNHLEAAILPASGQHLDQRRVVPDATDEVRQQNTVQGGKATPSLLRLRLVARVLLAGNAENQTNISIIHHSIALSVLV